MRRVTWLHLSDLHFRVDQGAEEYNRNVVLEAMLDDVRYRATKVAPELADLDFVVVSGDLAFSGGQREYSLAIDRFVAPIREAAGLSNRQGERLFVVPGNHDISRLAITQDARQVRERVTGRDDINDVLLNPSDAALMYERQRAYLEFFTEQFPGIQLQQPGQFYVANLQSTQGVDVSVIGLNSAWLAEGGRGDLGHLALGEAQVKKSLQARDAAEGVRVVLMHHPFDWLLEEDRAAVEALLSRHCHFVLRGHTHKADVIGRRTLFGDVLEIPCGSLYSSRDYGNGFNYVSVDLEKEQATIYLRRWSDERSEWVKDVVRTGDEADGRAVFWLPSALRPATAAGSVADKVRHAVGGSIGGDGWRRVDGVRPQVSPTRTIGRGAALGELLAVSKRENVTNVVGLPGVGKSTLVAMLASSVETGSEDVKREVVWLSLSESPSLVDIVGTVLTLAGRHALDLVGHTYASLARVLVQALRENRLFLVLDQADILLFKTGAANAAPWVDPLLNALLQDITPSKVVAVTSSPVRTSRGVTLPRFEVGGLALGDSVALLQQHGALGSATALHEAAVRTAGHPLSLVLVAQAAQSTQTVDRLLSSRHLWKGQGADISRRVLGPIMTENLSPDARTVLEVLGILRRPAPIDFVAALAGIQPQDISGLAEAALELSAKSMINLAGGLYWLHPIVQTYMETNAVNSTSLHVRAAEFFAGLAYSTEGHSYEQVLWLLESAHHAEQAEMVALGASITQSVSGTLFDTGAAAVAGHFASRFLALGSKKSPLSARDKARLLIILGRSMRQAGNVDQAIHVYERAAHEAERAGARDLIAQAMTLAGAAELGRRQYEQAARRSEEAANLARGLSNRSLEANALGNIGIALRHLRRFDESEEYLLEALAIMRLTGDEHGQSTQLNALAILAMERRHFSLAETYLLESLQIACDNSLHILKATALSNLAHLYAELQLLSWSAERYKEALRIWRSVPHPEQAAKALLGLAAIMATGGNLRSALVCVLAAKQLASLRPHAERDEILEANRLIEVIESASGEQYRTLLSEVEVDVVKELDDLLVEPTPRLGVFVADAESLELRDVPDDPRVWNDMAEAYIRERRSDDDVRLAEELLRAAIDRAPDQVASYVNLAHILSERQCYSEAEWFYRKTLQLTSDDPLVASGLGRLLIATGRSSEAVGFLRRSTEAWPDATEELRLLGLALTQAEEYAEAVTVYSRLHCLDPRDPVYRLELANALKDDGQIGEALGHLEVVLADDPWNVRALAAKCWSIGAGGGLDEAARTVEQAIGHLADSKDHARLLEVVGASYLEAGLADNAEVLLRRAIAADSKYAGSYYNLGVVLQRRDDAEGAKLAFAKCLELDPTGWRAHVNLSVLLANDGRFRESLHHCRLALRFKPGSREALENMQEVEDKLASVVSSSAAQAPSLLAKRSGQIQQNGPSQHEKRAHRLKRRRKH